MLLGQFLKECQNFNLKKSKKNKKTVGGDILHLNCLIIMLHRKELYCRVSNNKK